MTRPSRVALLFLALVATVAVAQGPVTPAANKADPAVPGRVEEYMRAQVRVNRFSGSVLLAQHGTPVISRGYGWANAEWEVPNTPQTKFRIGSITKQFTSMVVMQLQEQGKLKVQDPICQYLSPCPVAWKPVTVHHLLTHTSGIPSYTGLSNVMKTNMMPRTAEELVATFRDLPLEFEVGSQFKYNNSGYFLLGLIIEKIAGRKYDVVLREQIFDPLGMKDSGYDTPEVILPRRATGYAQRGAATINAPYLDMMTPYAAGALYSTVEDLLKWDQALYTDTLLPSAARDAMFTAFKGGYAYGWTIRPASPETFGHRQIAHGGGINGFSSMFVRLPDDNITAIVLANTTPTNTGRLARDLLAILLGEKYETPVERTVAKIDPKIYDAYTGEYQLTPAFSIVITREGNQIMAQATGQQKLELVPESETKFFLRVVDAQVTFVKDGQGSVTHLILHQGGKDQKGLKIK